FEGAEAEDDFAKILRGEFPFAQVLFDILAAQLVVLLVGELDQVFDFGPERGTEFVAVWQGSLRGGRSNTAGFGEGQRLAVRPRVLFRMLGVSDAGRVGRDFPVQVWAWFDCHVAFVSVVLISPQTFLAWLAGGNPG